MPPTDPAQIRADLDKLTESVQLMAVAMAHILPVAPAVPERPPLRLVR